MMMVALVPSNPFRSEPSAVVVRLLSGKMRGFSNAPDRGCSAAAVAAAHLTAFSVSELLASCIVGWRKKQEGQQPAECVYYFR